MYTPVELENLDFKISLFGYGRTEVDDFIEAIAADYEKLYKENVALKDKNALLADAIKEYKSMETALRDTVVSAHSISDDIKKNAYKEAENIITDAKNKAKEMRSEATQILSEAETKSDELKQQYGIYKSRIKAVIRSQLEALDMDGIENPIPEAEQV